MPRPKWQKTCTFWGSLFFSFAITLVIGLGIVEYPFKTGLVLSIVFPPYCLIDWYLQKRLLIPPVYQIPFIGLKGAGKTALVYRLCKQLYLYLPRNQYIETLNPCPFVFSYGDTSLGLAMQIKSSDAGGRFWQRPSRAFQYIHHGVIFVVDVSSSRSKLNDARYLLEKIIAGGRIGTRPILILATKADKARSVQADDIKKVLNLHHLRHGGVPREKVRLVMSGAHSDNSECPFTWLGDDLLHLILQYTGDGRQPERIISDPYMCKAFGEYTNPQETDELSKGMAWLMKQLEASSSSPDNATEKSLWWRKWKILRWARVYFWKPKRASYDEP